MPRVREFDVNDVLEKAKSLFWEKGYEAASIQDLVNATGVNRASLYQAFGGKRQLFEQALGRFRNETGQHLEAMTAGTEPGLERVGEVLRRIAADTLRDPRG